MSRQRRSSSWKMLSVMAPEATKKNRIPLPSAAHLQLLRQSRASALRIPAPALRALKQIALLGLGLRVCKGFYRGFYRGLRII